MSKKKNNKPEQPIAPAVHKTVTPATAPVSKWLIYAILFLFPFLLYVNTLGHEYALDDLAVITKNKFTQQGLAGIDDMLHTFYWEGFWNNYSGLYRPLSLITFAIEQQIAPNKPFLGHFDNVLLYSISITLLFTLLKRLLTGKPVIISFIAALLFAAHSVHTEVVANIKSRDEILSLLFFLISFHYLLDYVEQKKISKLLLAAFTYFLCVFSKEGGLMFLGVFPLGLYFFRNVQWKEMPKLLYPIFISGFVFIGIHQYVISHSSAQKHDYSYQDNALVAPPGATVNLSERLATATGMMGDQLKLLVLPHPLSYDYSFSQYPVVGWGNAKSLLSLLVIAGLLFIAIKKWKEKSIYSFSILFFAITIFMVSNMFFLIGATKADRFLFAPSLGFCLALAVLLHHYLGAKQKTADLSFKGNEKLLGIAAVILALYSFKTITRNPNWKNDETLFTTDVSASPGSARVHYNFATLYMDRYAMKETDPELKKQKLQLPIQEFEASIKIDSLVGNINSYQNLGSCYYHAKDYVNAIRIFEKAIRLNPNEASMYNNLGNAYFRVNNYDKCIELINKAMSLGFNADDAFNFLGSSYFGKHNYGKAIENFLKALEKNSKQEDVLNNLASAFGMVGDFNNAILHFNKVIELNPNNAQAHYFISITYDKMGQKDKALEYLNKARALGMKV